MEICDFDGDGHLLSRSLTTPVLLEIKVVSSQNLLSNNNLSAHLSFFQSVHLISFTLEVMCLTTYLYVYYTPRQKTLYITRTTS